MRFTKDTFEEDTVRRFNVVCNAGGQFPKAVEDITENGWHAVIDTNLNGTFRTCREAFRTVLTPDVDRDREGGNVVTIIADMHNGFPNMAHTGAARAGVENLTKTLALEWSRHGIRVNAVAPGVIYSESAAANYDDPEFFQKFQKDVPGGRLGKPSDVSSAVCFLLSDAASFISGTTLRVDACQSLYRRIGFRA